MTQLKKVAIVISSPIYFRNYFLSGALSAVNKSYKISLLMPHSMNELRHNPRLKAYDIEFYNYPEVLVKSARLSNELSLFSSIGLSKDFAYRVKRKYNDSPHLNNGKLNSNRRSLRAKVFAVKIILRFLSMTLFRRIINRIVIAAFRSQSPIQKYVLDKNIDILMCPSSAAGTEDFDICAYASNKRNRTKTILLIDNWDNLSSKYIMPHQPTHTVVWGEQTRFHGISIQNVSPNSISALGTPRFYCYSKKSRLTTGQEAVLPVLPQKYLLFVGSQTYFDEVTVIENLKLLINKRFSDHQIVYRPHPWRESFNKESLDIDGIIIDPTLTTKSQTVENMKLPDMDLSAYVINNANVIIGGCTSMIIEASLLRKPYLLLAHDDGNPIQSPFEYYIRNEHQSLTAMLNNVSVCYSMDDLDVQLNELMNRKIPDKDVVLDYILSPKYKDYSDNLRQILDCMFS